MREQKEINTEILMEWLNSGKNVNIIDIRPKNEREEWYIPGSIHLDVYEELNNNIFKSLESVNLDKSTPLVAVCAGGNASLKAAEILKKAGYEAYSLKGGMKSWNFSWNTASVSFSSFEIIQFRRTGKGCLSYMIISGKEAIIIDASLPIQVYQEYLDKRKSTLKYVADTHIHADHLSRTRALAEAYDIEPGIPANKKLKFPFIPISEGTIFQLGMIEIRAIHTPGHTSESTCYLVNNEVLLTGDTLFINGVGRPDLKASHHDAKEKSQLLYHSIRKLLELDTSIAIMPGHTSKPIPFDQIVIQASLEDISRKLPLLHLKKSEFVQSLLNRIPATPENYLTILNKNISGKFRATDPANLEVGANRCAIS